MKESGAAKRSGAPEKRIHPRRPYRTKVVFDDEFGDGLFYVHSENISIGGIFLASDIPVRVGTLLFLSFHLPPHKRFIHVTGEVVRRSRDEEHGPPGMGIRFVGLSEMARRRLEDFLRA